MAERIVTYPVGTIAKLLMLTERRVQQLAAEGSLPKAARGQYELAPTVQAYIRYLRDRAVGGDDVGNDIGVLKARMIKARARIAEAEAGQIDGSLIEIERVAQTIEADYAEVRTKLLAIAPERAPQLHRCKTVREVMDLLTSLITDALEALSHGGVRQPRT